MGNLIKVSAYDRERQLPQLRQQPTNNGCYAWQDEQQELTRWQSGNVTRERQLGLIFDGISLRPAQPAQPQSSMDQLNAVMSGMFYQCGIECRFDTVEFHDTNMAFVFYTRQNMMSNSAVLATQYVKEQLQGQLNKTVSTGIKPYGSQYQIIVWVFTQ